MDLPVRLSECCGSLFSAAVTFSFATFFLNFSRCSTIVHDHELPIHRNVDDDVVGSGVLGLVILVGRPGGDGLVDVFEQILLDDLGLALFLFGLYLCRGKGVGFSSFFGSVAVAASFFAFGALAPPVPAALMSVGSSVFAGASG